MVDETRHHHPYRPAPGIRLADDFGGGVGGTMSRMVRACLVTGLLMLILGVVNLLVMPEWSVEGLSIAFFASIIPAVIAGWIVYARG